MIFIVQALCPNRHAILALMMEGKPGEESELCALLGEQVAALVAAPVINPWCGICGATRDKWSMEAAPTKYATIEQARVDAARLETENLLSRAVLDAQGRSYDSTRKN